MIYQNKDNVFHLQTKDTSYLLRALPSGQLESLYYGKKIRNVDDFTFLYDKHEAGYSETADRVSVVIRRSEWISAFAFSPRFGMRFVLDKMGEVTVKAVQESENEFTCRCSRNMRAKDK